MFPHPSAKGKSICQDPLEAGEIRQQDAQHAQMAAWQSCGDKEGSSGGCRMLGSWQPGAPTSCRVHSPRARHTAAQTPLRVPIPIFLLCSSHLNSVLLQEGGPGYCRYIICSSAPFPRHVQEGTGNLLPCSVGKVEKRAGFVVQQRPSTLTWWHWCGLTGRHR